MSSSRQRDYDEFPDDWCTGLDHPYVPWDTVERSHAEFLDWRDFLEVGSQVQVLLCEALRLHKDVAAPLFRVHVLVPSPPLLSFFLSWLCLV